MLVYYKSVCNDSEQNWRLHAEQNFQHFADDNFKYIFLNENAKLRKNYRGKWFSGPIHSKTELVLMQ